MVICALSFYLSFSFNVTGHTDFTLTQIFTGLIHSYAKGACSRVGPGPLCLLLPFHTGVTNVGVLPAEMPLFQFYPAT